MFRRGWGLAFLVVLGCGSGASKGGEEREAPTPSDEPESSQPTPDLPSNPIARERAELDQKVWKDEVLAQEHERAFVELWDALRASKEPESVLAEAPFDVLRLGRPSAEVEELAGGVSRRGFEAPADLDGAAWKKLVQAQAGQGWKLRQSEWHHSKFVPASDGAPARSEVSMLLHGEHESGRRAAVSGVLKVEWASAVAGESPRPALVDASELSLLERDGPGAFEQALELNPRPWKARDPHVQPVLLWDLNEDGLSEILLAGANKLYVNKGNFEFEERDLAPSFRGWIATGAIADVDGDGHRDLLLAASGGGIGWLPGKRGDLEFGEPRPIPTPNRLDNPFNLTLGDIDADGDLDIFVTQYKPPYRHGQMPTPYYDANDGFPSYLLRNEGKGEFTDITAEAGLGPKQFRRTYTSSLIDLDEDRDLDLLVVSDFSGADVYLNDGTGVFEDVTERALDERASFGMSYTFGDYDGDGHDDLYVVGMSSTTARRLELLNLGREEFEEHSAMRAKMAYGNRLYFGDGKGNYAATPMSEVVARSGWSWGSVSFDVENDGDLDLYVANGFVSRGSAADYCTTFWTHDIYTGGSELDGELGEFYLDEFQDVISEGTSWNGYEHNKLYRNEAGTTFTELGWQYGLAIENDSRAVAVDDLDGDGRQDLVVTLSEFRAGEVRGEALHERTLVLKNTLPDTGHWVGIQLRGKRSPLNAEVVLYTAEGVQKRRVVTGDSVFTQHPPHVHFGLGALTKVERVEVRWADGTTKTLGAPTVDRWHQIK